MSATEDTKISEVVKLISTTPNWAYLLMSKLVGATFVWQKPSDFFKYYQSLDPNDNKHLALEELAQANLTKNTASIVAKVKIQEIAAKYTPKPEDRKDVAKSMFESAQTIHTKAINLQTIEQQTTNALQHTTPERTIETSSINRKAVERLILKSPTYAMKLLKNLTGKTYPANSRRLLKMFNEKEIPELCCKALEELSLKRIITFNNQAQVSRILGEVTRKYRRLEVKTDLQTQAQEANTLHDELADQAEIKAKQKDLQSFLDFLEKDDAPSLDWLDRQTSNS